MVLHDIRYGKNPEPVILDQLNGMRALYHIAEDYAWVHKTKMNGQIVFIIKDPKEQETQK